jgi:hypothetical protein
MTTGFRLPNKFKAALAAAQSGDAPILLRVESLSGHGGSGKRSLEDADELSFLADRLEIDVLASLDKLGGTEHQLPVGDSLPD